MAGSRSRHMFTLLAALSMLGAGPAAAQQRPLRKTDLVRLLTNPSLTKARVAALIRADCLAFDPTTRDRADLQDLGADAGVLAAVDGCVRAKAAAAPGESAPAAPRPAPRAAAPPRRRAPAPVQRAPAGPVLGPPTMVALDPGDIRLRAGEPRQLPVSVTVRDAQGHPLPGETVEFRPLTPDLGVNAFSVRTSGTGVAVATFGTDLLKRDGAIGIFVRGAQLGMLRVAVPPVVLSAASTQFVAGADQRAVAGAPLGGALVFEVRDTTGAPVPGRTVSFAATNGAVSPDSGTTDERGQIVATVTAGRKAGEAVVTASVGAIRKQATIPVAPGPAATLAVQRDTVPVAQLIELTSTKPVYLWVKAQDTFGNSVPVAGLQASAGDGRVVQVAAVDTTGGMGRVTVQARASGSERLDLQMGAARQVVPVQVLLPVAAGQWVVALRAGYTTFDYSYRPTWKGHAGPIGEIEVGRNVWRGLTIAVAATFAPLKVDTSTAGPFGVNLLDTSLRLEYSFTPQAKASPVLLAGGGNFQTTSAQLGNTILHVSYFWLAGVGADFKVSPATTGELRITTHQLEELTSTTYNAQTGSLIAVTAGLRFGF